MLVVHTMAQRFVFSELSQDFKAISLLLKFAVGIANGELCDVL